jgi:hypothetical protein
MDYGVILYYAHLGIDSQIKHNNKYSRNKEYKEKRLKELENYKKELVKEEIKFLKERK